MKLKLHPPWMWDQVNGIADSFVYHKNVTSKVVSDVPTCAIQRLWRTASIFACDARLTLVGLTYTDTLMRFAAP